MRDDVLIILNDAEEFKEKLALELVEQLTLRSISASCLKPTKNLMDIITARSPKLLVLDFVLGNFGTAHDILGELSNDSCELYDPLPIIVWTDELNVSVAVAALKLGAADFIEIDQSHSIDKVLKSVLDLLPHEDSKGSFCRWGGTSPETTQFAAQSQSYQQCLGYALSVARQQLPVVVLYGEIGTGRSSIAEFIHFKRLNAGIYKEIDYQYFPKPIQLITGDKYNSRYQPWLSYNATVMIDHVEFDTGELIEAVLAMQEAIWDNPASTPMLIVGTNCETTASSWCNLIKARRIDIPSLPLRREDIFTLINGFCMLIPAKNRTRNFTLSPQLLSQLMTLPWPGNLRQLKAAVLDAITIDFSFSELDNQHDSTTSDCSHLTKEEKVIFYTMKQSHDRWIRHHTRLCIIPSPLEARRALDESDFNLRIAAARLGTGVSQIKQALSVADCHDNDNPLAEYLMGNNERV